MPRLRQSQDGRVHNVRRAAVGVPSPPTTAGSTTRCATARTAIACWTPHGSACRALQLFYEGQLLAVIAARLGLRSRQYLWSIYRRGAVEAVTR